jgi:hypothetical protein
MADSHEKRPGCVLVSLHGDFWDIAAFSMRFETALRKLVADEFAAGTVDKPLLKLRIEEPEPK